MRNEGIKISAKDNTYSNSGARTFLLSDVVDNESIGKLLWGIIDLIREDDEKDEKEKGYERKPIKLYINSFGGSAYDMWGLIDIMLSSKTPIYTYCVGSAMSAAFKIFLAGQKRFCYKHSTFMYHQMTVYGGDQKYQDVVEGKDELDTLNRQIEEFVIERTRFTREQVNEVREKKKDIYIHSDEAVKYGIVDEVL